MSLEADIKRWFRVFPQNQKKVSDDVKNFKFLYDGLGLDDINFYSMFLLLLMRDSVKMLSQKRNTILPTNKFRYICSTSSYHQVLIKIKIA